MKYNISDIVKAAKQIADLENSDFISWNENIRLLNEAWTAVHQKLINKGDFTFVNEMDIGKEQELPRTFIRFHLFWITTTHLFLDILLE